MWYSFGVVTFAVLISIEFYGIQVVAETQEDSQQGDQCGKHCIVKYSTSIECALCTTVGIDCLFRGDSDMQNSEDVFVHSLSLGLHLTLLSIR